MLFNRYGLWTSIFPSLRAAILHLEMAAGQLSKSWRQRHHTSSWVAQRWCIPKPSTCKCEWKKTMVEKKHFRIHWLRVFLNGFLLQNSPILVRLVKNCTKTSVLEDWKLLFSPHPSGHFGECHQLRIPSTKEARCGVWVIFTPANTRGNALQTSNSRKKWLGRCLKLFDV